jgi:5-methyltetrahydrofolate--homocysteine methyltransferase
MTSEWLERLAAGEILVADGAMGSLLMERGLEPGECPEALNLTRPELLREIAGLYLAAGADIIQTNSFGASPPKLAHYGLAERTEEINLAAVTAVRDAVGREALVSGSIGPSGKILEPYGDTDPAEVRSGFLRQVRALVEAGVDLLCVETMTDLSEAKLAIEAAREGAPSTPILATMTFDATPRGFFTVMGVDIERAARGLAEAGAKVIGSNCGQGSKNMIAIAREFRRCTDRPLLIQSNAGLPEVVGDRIVYDESPEFMADCARELIGVGVAIIGGCCGTTPEYTASLRAVVDQASSSPL